MVRNADRTRRFGDRDRVRCLLAIQTVAVPVGNDSTWWFADAGPLNHHVRDCSTQNRNAHTRERDGDTDATSHGPWEATAT